MDRGESFCAGFGAEDHGGSTCISRQWRLVFFFFFGDYVVAVSCGCDYYWWFLGA